MIKGLAVDILRRDGGSVEPLVARGELCTEARDGSGDGSGEALAIAGRQFVAEVHGGDTVGSERTGVGIHDRSRQILRDSLAVAQPSAARTGCAAVIGKRFRKVIL